MPDPFVGNWRITESDNPRSFPTGNVQTIRLVNDGTSSYYVMTWLASGQNASFSPLYPISADRIGNPEATGTLGIAQGTFDVRIDILSQAPPRISANSAAITKTQVPGPLVGQWGAESTGGGPGDGGR
ncbi:MAG TPA: hypothetical protein VHN15_01390 [Thermoanaerobaculia bacterium]|nr:hypothetical protein [Thermoanaerobaculia bacterium]